MTDAQIVQEAYATVIILVLTGVGFYVYGWLWADRKLKSSERVVEELRARTVPTEMVPAKMAELETRIAPVKRLAIGEDEV